MTYFLMLVTYIMLIIYIEAITEIIVSSDMPLILWLRNWLYKVNPTFIGKLFKCGYCFSVWVAMPFAFVAPGNITEIQFIDIIVKWMVLHRLSNIMHEGFIRWLKRVPWVFVIQKTELKIQDIPSNVIEVSEKK